MLLSLVSDVATSYLSLLELDRELPPRRLMESFLEDAFTTLKGDLRLQAGLVYAEGRDGFSHLKTVGRLETAAAEGRSESGSRTSSRAGAGDVSSPASGGSTGTASAGGYSRGGSSSSGASSSSGGDSGRTAVPR